MVDVWKDFFAGLPYDIQIKAEKYYQSIIYTLCRLCGMDILTEVATNKGRIDAVLDAGKHLYILEFKLQKTADAALARIDEKSYAEKYLRPAREKGQTIHAVGINFSYAPEERTITGWKEKILG